MISYNSLGTVAYSSRESQRARPVIIRRLIVNLDKCIAVFFNVSSTLYFENSNRLGMHRAILQRVKCVNSLTPCVSKSDRSSLTSHFYMHDLIVSALLTAHIHGQVM